MENYSKLSEIVGNDGLSLDPAVLSAYESDLSHGARGSASCVVKPTSSEQVSEVIKFCNDRRIPVVPCSSGIHFYGAAIPKEGGVVLDLSKMDRILEIDRENRRVRFEAGVSWGKLCPELKKAGYRVIMPLAAHEKRSVLTDFLEREEPVNQVYDYGEPLQAMEVVWPTGEIFRLGSASVEGYPDSPSRGGNPSGPGLDFYRFFQCAQGTMGVVTWTNMKIQSIPVMDKVLFSGSERLDELVAFLYRVMPRRVGQEVLILNRTDLALILAGAGQGDRERLKAALPTWTLILVLSGLKRRPEEKIAYEEKFLFEVVRNEFPSIGLRENLPGMPDIGKVMLGVLREPWPGDRTYWKLGAGGAFKSIFFHCRPSSASRLISIAEKAAAESGLSKETGVYLQPIEHNRACRPEVTVFYDPSDLSQRVMAERFYREAGRALLKEGAVFTRPYGELAPIVYERAASYAAYLKRLKKLFDPNNIMNPSTLCF